MELGDMTCTHNWDIDQTGKGQCKKCLTVVQFDPTGKEKPVILSGPAPKRSPMLPSKVSPEEKDRIVEETDHELVPVVAKRYGLAPSTVYTWRARRRKPGVGPLDLSLRRDGDAVDVYIRGEKWATLTETSPRLTQMSHRFILDLVRRYLRGDTITTKEKEA